MTDVDKPEGFELRFARAAKNHNGKLWLPQDALYDAQLGFVESPPCCATVIVWYTRLENGNLSCRYRISQEHDRQAVALLADALADLTNP